MDTAKKTTKKRKSSVASLDKRKARSGWLFVLPFLIGFVTIYLPMIYNSIYYSFNEYRPMMTPNFIFVGLENYRKVLFENTEFVQTLTTGLTELVLDIPAIVIFSLFIAVILNQKMLGRAVFRAIFFIPVILSTGLIGDIEAKASAFMNNSQTMPGEESSTGSSASEIISRVDIAVLFEGMKIGGGLVEIVTDLVNDIYNIINRSGVQMLVFLAGLQSISPAIYESCSIDGATAWETFWKITFPMITPMILVNAIYTVIDSFTSNQNSVMTLVYSTYKSGEQVISSAMAWLYFLVVILVIAIVSGVLSAYIFYQRRD